MHLLAPQLLCPEIIAFESAFCMATLLLEQTNREHHDLLISHPLVTPNSSCTRFLYCLKCKLTWGSCLWFGSCLLCLQGEDGDYQAVGSMAGMERQELNYAALEFIGGRSKKGASGKKEDGCNYREIKAKWIAILPCSLDYTRRSSRTTSTTST